jgi:hypothetical protein
MGHGKGPKTQKSHRCCVEATRAQSTLATNRMAPERPAFYWLVSVCTNIDCKPAREYCAGWCSGIAENLHSKGHCIESTPETGIGRIPVFHYFPWSLQDNFKKLLQIGHGSFLIILNFNAMYSTRLERRLQMPKPFRQTSNAQLYVSTRRTESWRRDEKRKRMG